MFELVDQSLTQMEYIVKSPDANVADVNKSMNVENEINNYRKQLKNQNVDDINNRLYNYQLGVYYMDLISECEKLGDYVVNVIECTGLLKK